MAPINIVKILIFLSLFCILVLRALLLLLRMEKLHSQLKHMLRCTHDWREKDKREVV